MIIHAYGAGNEPYHIWEGMKRNDPEYAALKEERSQVLWRAIESIIPDVRKRVVLDLVGSPITHERFLRRPRGTYGAATEDYFKDGSTPISNFVLAGDSIFPGIGKCSSLYHYLLKKDLTDGILSTLIGRCSSSCNIRCKCSQCTCQPI